MGRADVALNEIKAARAYTLNLLADLDEHDWFRQPTEGVTHIAWQVGHLAMAQFFLGLARLRGPRETDAQIIDPAFLAHFGKGSTPEPNPENNPSPAQIRSVFDRVYRQVLSEVPEMNEDWDTPPLLKPHPQFTTKLGSLFWCARHEMAHAGQIGLLRRLFGRAPQW